MEYIRRDLEGGDIDTRRGAATELVRGLLEHFAKEVTEIFGSYIQQYLAAYEGNKMANWKAKDSALYLIIALSARSVGHHVRYQHSINLVCTEFTLSLGRHLSMSTYRSCPFLRHMSSRNYRSLLNKLRPIPSSMSTQSSTC